MSAGDTAGAVGAEAALDTARFYRESCQAGYVRTADIARNIAWTCETRWGVLEITINLSKPEKRPEDIAAAAGGGPAGAVAAAGDAPAAPACPLCVRDADVECGRARRLTLGGGPWGLWYSPYAYFPEHCIAMSWQHRPMHLDEAAFACLFDFCDAVPHYTVGSNAELPIVGGSILGHDHFQGGRHRFPLQDAPSADTFSLPAFPQVDAAVVRWPLSVLRLAGECREQLQRAAMHVLGAWRAWNDPAVGLRCSTDGAPHHTVTPMLWREGDRYVLDLALRSNLTSPEHPLGVFHPHEHLWRVKRENIGLIEVMGLAILPPRLLDEFDVDDPVQCDAIGLAFAEVLECCGVFKWDAPGRAALRRFLDSL